MDKVGVSDLFADLGVLNDVPTRDSQGEYLTEYIGGRPRSFRKPKTNFLGTQGRINFRRYRRT